MHHVFDKFMEVHTAGKDLALRCNFVTGHRDELPPLLLWDLIQKCEETLNTKRECPIPALQSFCAVPCGFALNKEKGTKMQCSLYLRNIQDSLQPLEANMFMETDVDSSKELKKANACIVSQGEACIQDQSIGCIIP